MLRIASVKEVQKCNTIISKINNTFQEDPYSYLGLQKMEFSKRVKLFKTTEKN